MEQSAAVQIILPQIDKQIPAAPGGVDIVGFPQLLHTRSFGNPDLLFLPLLELARDAVVFGEKLAAHGENREHAIMMSGIRMATTLMGESSFSLSTRGLAEENHYTVDLDGETFSLSTRLYAMVSRRTSMFHVEIAGKIREGPYVVRGVGDDSAIVQVDEQQLRQARLFSTSLAEEFLQVKMDMERRSSLSRNMDRGQESAEISLTMPLGTRKYAVVLRKKDAAGEWDVLEAQTRKSVGMLSAETEGHLRLLLLAISGMAQK
jgi:hypothetical protein